MQPPPLPPAASPAPHRKTAGLAIASLVLGILSMFCGTFITGIPAIILGIIALVRIGKTPGLGGQGLAIAGLVTGGIGSVFMTAIIVAIMLPAFSAAREHAVQAQCFAKVKQITVAAIAFAQEHNDTLPKTLADLKPHLGSGTDVDRILTCSSAKNQSKPSYHLEHAGEKTTGLPATTVIIVETECRHRGRRSVGHLDGRVELRAGP